MIFRGQALEAIASGDVVDLHLDERTGQLHIVRTHPKPVGKIGDRVRVTLEGELVAYDGDLGKWTLRGHSVPDRHVAWDYELHWGTTFKVLDR